MTDQHRTTDETQPHPLPDAEPTPSPRPDVAPEPPAVATEPPEPGRPPDGRPDQRLRADPARPSDTAWREPAWFPPKDQDRRQRASPVAIVVGLALIAVGLYFFVDRTLGIALPRIQWSAIWPVALIVIGGLVLLRSVSRRT